MSSWVWVTSFGQAGGQGGMSEASRPGRFPHPRALALVALAIFGLSGVGLAQDAPEIILPPGLEEFGQKLAPVNPGGSEDPANSAGSPLRPPTPPLTPAPGPAADQPAAGTTTPAPAADPALPPPIDPLQAERQAAVLARYLQVALRKPADAATATTLLRAAEERGGIDPLLKDLREKAASSSPEAGSYATLLANILRQRQQVREALAVLSEGLKTSPENLDLLRLRGELRLEAGDVREGLSDLQKALQVLETSDYRANPALRRPTLERLARAYYELGQFSEGEATLRKLLETAPSEAGLRSSWAEYLEKRGQPGLAVEMYQWLADHAPAYQRATAWREIARLQTTRGKLPEAEQALRRGLELAGPGHWLRIELQANLTKLLLRRGGLEEFRQELERKHQQAPRDLRALMDLRQLAENLAKREEQLHWQRKIAEINPGNLGEQVRLVELEIAAGHLETALNQVRALLERQPGNFPLSLKEAEVLLRLRQGAEAADKLRALWRSATDPALLSQVEGFLRDQHLTDLLVEMFQSRLEADPTSVEIRTRLADALILRRDFSAAREVLAGLAREEDPPARRAAASFQAYGILQASGDIDGALKQLQLAVELDPLHPPYVLELARVFTEAGRTEEAQVLLERILERMRDPLQPSYVQVDQRLFELLRGVSRPDAPSVESSFAERQRRERLRMRSQADAVEKMEWKLPLDNPPRKLPPGTPLESGEPDPAAPAKPAVPDTPLGHYIQKLAAAAQEANTPGAWLRLGRWQGWNRSYEEARQAARAAWELQPGLAPAGQLLFGFVGQEQDPAAALDLLDQLEKAGKGGIAPPAEFLKKRAEIQARAGQLTESLATLREITRQMPREAAGWQELATALQRAGLWFDALEAWRNALEHSHVDGKLAILRPYLGALQRLQLHARAHDLLEQAMERAGSDEERLKVFDELLNYAKAQGELVELEKSYAAKLEQQPNHPFLRQAQARIKEARGEMRGVADSLAEVAWLTPNSLKLLQELAERAESAQEYGSAARYLAEAARDPKAPAAIVVKLAELQEKIYDFEAAGESWRQALAKAPESIGALRGAAEFELRRHRLEPARDLLARAVGVDAFEQDLRFLLAQVQLELGETPAARDHLETLIHQLPPLLEDASGLLGELPPLELPPSIDLNVPVAVAFDQVILQDDLLVRDAAREFWRNDRVRSAGLAFSVPHSRLRLEAIARLGRLVDAEARAGTDPVARQKWMYRWRTSPTAERLWAAYYSRSAYDLWLISQPLANNATEQRDTALQAFIWLNLDAGGFENLSRWLKQSDPHRELRRQFFVIALSQLLTARQTLGEGVGDLMPRFSAAGALEENMWPVASLLAATDFIPEAIELGSGALETRKHLVAPNGLTLATWRLRLGQRRETIALLRQQIAAGESHSLSVQALATRWCMQLLPPGERGPFVEWLERMDSAKGALPPAHRLLSLAVAHTVQGDEPKAHAALDRLLALRPASYEEIRVGPNREMPSQTYAFWNFIYLTGFQLMEWHYPRQACYLWERALADPAQIALQDDDSRDLARTVRKLLYTERMIASAEVPAIASVREYLRGGDDIMELRALAAQMEEQQLFPELATLTETLVQREQDVEQTPDRLLRVYLQAGDLPAARRRLADLRLAATEEGEAPLRAHQAAMLFAQSLQENGQLRDAQLMLEQQLKEFSGDTECLQRLIGIYEARGLPEKVAPLCQTFLQLHPDSGELYSQWATSLQKTGRGAEALSTLTQRFPAGHAMRPVLLPVLFNLRMELGEVDQAEAILREMLETDQPASAMKQGARALAEKGRREAGVGILRDALRRNRSPMYLFEVLQSLVTEFLQADSDVAQVRRDLRQMAQISTVLEGTKSGLYQTRLEVGRKRNILPEIQAELELEWRDGRGDKEAGMALLNLLLEAPKPDLARGERLVSQLLDHGDLGDDLAERMLNRLKETKQWSLAIQATRSLRKRAPGDFELALHEVEAVSLAGKRADAETLLRKLETNVVLNSQDALPFARIYQRWGDRARAREMYATALPANPVFFMDDQAEYLGQIIQGGDLADARERLRRFYRSGSPSTFAPLLTYLQAAGKLGPGTRIEPDVDFLGYSERLRISWRAALLEHAVGVGNAPLVQSLAQAYGDQILQKPGLVEKVRALAPDSGRALRYQAGYLAERGKMAEARASLERALTLALPESEEAKSIRKEIEALAAAIAK